MSKDYSGNIIVIDEDECRVIAKLGYGQLYEIEHSDGTTDIIPTELLIQYL